MLQSISKLSINILYSKSGHVIVITSTKEISEFLLYWLFAIDSSKVTKMACGRAKGYFSCPARHGNDFPVISDRRNKNEGQNDITRGKRECRQ